MFNKKYPMACEGIWGDAFSVTFCSICDNNCKFCIAKGTLEKNQKLKRNVDAMIETTLKHCEGRDMVEISGGEPFLFMDELEKYVTAIRPHVKSIRIFTSLPKTIMDNWEKFLNIYENVDTIIASYQHYDSDLNNFLYRAHSNHNRLEILAKIADLNADKLRVNMNLIRYGFDTKSEIDKGLAFLAAIHVKHVRLNEMQKADFCYVDFQKAYGKKLPSPYIYGCVRPIKLRKFKGLDLTIKVACFHMTNFKRPTRRELKFCYERARRKPESNTMVIREDGSYSYGYHGKIENED